MEKDVLEIMDAYICVWLEVLMRSGNKVTVSRHKESDEVIMVVSNDDSGYVESFTELSLHACFKVAMETII